MRALTVAPGVPGSAELRRVRAPDPRGGAVLVETVAIGVCGTDREIARGAYGSAPPGCRRLVLGHESVGRVLAAPRRSELVPGDWVVGMVRRPDPVPCLRCAAGEVDLCKNGRFTECGIRGRHGYAADRYRIAPEFAVPVPAELGVLGVLVEPTSVIVKAFDQIDALECVRGRAQRALVIGAGPIGLLATLLAVARGLDVHVLDRVRSGPKPGLVRRLGAGYHAHPLSRLRAEWDLVLECTGAPSLLFDAIKAAGRNGVVCLLGLSERHMVRVDAGSLNREWVLENNAVLGSVAANRRHYERAVDQLARADRGWLADLITRREPVERWSNALDADAQGVKSVLEFMSDA